LIYSFFFFNQKKKIINFGFSHPLLLSFSKYFSIKFNKSTFFFFLKKFV
jgi:hypothetical protein